MSQLGTKVVQVKSFGSEKTGYFCRFTMYENQDESSGSRVFVVLEEGDDFNRGIEAGGFLPDDALTTIRDAINAHLARKGT